MTLDKTMVLVILRGILCLGFIMFSMAFILFLVTNTVIYGEVLTGDKVNHTTAYPDGYYNETGIPNELLGYPNTYNCKCELVDDNLNETEERQDEKQHEKESEEWLRNSAYVPNNNNTTCNPVYNLMEQWIPNGFKCYNT